MGYYPAEAQSSLSTLNADQLKALAARITETVTYHLDTAHVSFVSLLSSTARMVLTQPPSTNSATSSSELVITAWGEGVTKAVVSVFNDFTGGFTQPTAEETSLLVTNRATARSGSTSVNPTKFLHLFKVDRIQDEGQLMNHVPFCFTFNSSVQQVGVLVQQDGDPRWYAINEECSEGWCGNCTSNGPDFSCCSPHTSTFYMFTSAGLSPLDSTAPGSGLNMILLVVPAAVLIVVGLLFLIALYCFCVSRRFPVSLSNTFSFFLEAPNPVEEPRGPLDSAVWSQYTVPTPASVGGYADHAWP